MRRTGASARPARAPKEPLRFADEEQYTTEQPPSALRRTLRRMAERKQADGDDSAQSGAITGEKFVAREMRAAKDAGLSPQREKAPIHNRDARPKKVKLPPGWTASSPQEVEAYLKHLNNVELNKIVRLHGYAFFSGGCVQTVGQAAAKKWFLDHGLVVGPWHKEGFLGMCNSEALGKQRFANSWRESNEQRSSDATFDRLERLGLPKEDLSHKGQYDSLARDDLLTEAFLRGVDMPKGDDRRKKMKEWLPLKDDVCVDCGRRRTLVRVEHAKGGEHDGERRKPPCPGCNTGERADCDAAIDAAYEEGETLTKDACEAVPKSHFTTIPRLTGRFLPRYGGLLDLRIAYAQRPGASAEDTEVLALAERLAADVRAPEDQEALHYASTLRHRPIRNDYGPTYEEVRRAFQKKEAAMREERNKSKAAAKARREDLPTFRAKMRVVVKTTGARGVVQCTTSSGAWIHVARDGVPDTKAYRRSQLDIDTSRKPSARKPSARKPASSKKSRK